LGVRTANAMEIGAVATDQLNSQLTSLTVSTTIKLLIALAISVLILYTLTLCRLEFGDYDPFIPFDFGDDSDEQLQYLVRRHRHHPALSCWSNPNNRATILFSP